jgi:branched-chain amino acid transport system permease protein
MDSVNPKHVRQSWHNQVVAFAPYIISGLVLMILPLLISPYLQSIMTRVLIMAIFAISLDLLMGYTGLISLGHAGYFGIAAYTTGILAIRYGIENFWLIAPVAILMAALAAMILGFLALRVSGIYFILVTFATAELLRSAAAKWSSLTGGDDGLPGIVRPDLGIHWSMSDTTNFYYFVSLVFIVCFFLLYRVTNSPFGHALQGIREDERRMRALGYHTWAYKYIAFIVAAVFAGVSGILFTYLNGIVYPSMIGVVGSIEPLIMVMIGGAGTLFGPVIGAAFIVWLGYFASIYIPERWPLILGLVFVLCVMYFRQGIGVSLRDFWRRLRYRYGSTEG